MAGDVVTLASEEALLQDQYARPTHRRKKKRKRSSTSHQERPMAKAHPGFQAVQASIAKKSGVPMKNAGAILATASREASPAAKKKNPALKQVKGKAKSAKKKSYAPSPIAQAMGAPC